jgi:hypothetical protein
MEIVHHHYGQRLATCINRYRLYLRVISIYYLLTYDGKQVHPELARGQRVISRISTIHWVEFPKPPKKDATLWRSFITDIIIPYINSNTIAWSKDVTPTYHTTFMISSTDNSLYQLTNTGYKIYQTKQYRKRPKYLTYNASPDDADPDPSILDTLQNVDVTHRSNDIQMLCHSDINRHGTPIPNENISDLQSLYSNLPKALQKLCGNVQLPPDGGESLIQYLTSNAKPLLGASDASLKEGQSAHAWILSTGETDHIADPLLQISGKGPVDGYSMDMSSARGEIQGQTALAIMSSLLLKAQDLPNLPVIFYGDNSGVQRKCNMYPTQKLRDHRQPNQDLHLEYHNATRQLNKKVEWVKGHQDKGKEWNNTEDLKSLKLSQAAPLNIWCDRQAEQARKMNYSHPDADVLPAEKWAVYSCYPVKRKLTGKLDIGIHDTLYHESLTAYLHKKHNICDSKLDMINTEGLRSYMGQLSVLKRASTAKLIHRWIPTNACLQKQGRSDSNLCPRCGTHTENADHILECNNVEAQEKRQSLLYNMLNKLKNANTSIIILSALENKLTDLMHVPSLHRYIPPVNQITSNTRDISEAIHSQNILGWHQFMRGYISKYWHQLQNKSCSKSKGTTKSTRWDIFITKTTLDLHRLIWEDRNLYVHGATIRENQEKARAAVIRNITALYNNLPRLASRYHQIHDVPLEYRLRRTTKELQDWMARIQHQIKVTDFLNNSKPPGQLTLQQAYARHKMLQTNRHHHLP